jgi:hypothetical protein
MPVSDQPACGRTALIRLRFRFRRDWHTARRGPWRRRARTGKPCGPGTRCWCQVGGGEVGPTGSRSALFADDGGKTNSSPGRARHRPLKPSRREGRVFRWTCGDYPCAFYTARGAAGAPCTRLSLRPSLEGRAAPSVFLGRSFSNDSGGSCREIAEVCVLRGGYLKIESHQHNRRHSGSRHRVGAKRRPMTGSAAVRNP